MTVPRFGSIKVSITLFAAAWLAVQVGAGPSLDAGGPPRPDLSEMSPQQAAQAIADYHRASEQWWKAHEAKWTKAVLEGRGRAAMRAAQRARVVTTTSNVSVTSDYRWEVEAEEHQLAASARERLARDGLLIAGSQVRQSFSIYADESVPPFITTDSLLNGFHVLLESTLRRFEIARAARLRGTLEACWGNRGARFAELNVPPAAVAPYERQAALVIGPALRLLGSSVRLGDAALEQEVDRSVQRIRRAEAVALPDWLAPATDDLLALDFRRCKPIGFYAASPALADYYRAVRWLQMVPFRASRPVEAGAIALLAEADVTNQEQSFRGFAQSGAAVWGASEALDVAGLAQSRPQFLQRLAVDPAKASAVAIEALALGDRLRGAQASDRIRGPGAAASLDATATVLAPAVLPDTRFCEALRAAKADRRALPEALEVGAWLGSDLALSNVQKRDGEGVAKALNVLRDKAAEPPYWGSSVPERYYYLLRALLDPPDPAAPPFMRGEVWQRKSLQTALAGWAQLRHAWELQAKLMVVFVSGSRRPAGFVEPNTEFYVRLHDLVSTIVERMQEADAFDARTAEADYLRGELRLLASVGLTKVDVDLSEFAGIWDRERLFNLAIAAFDFDPTFPHPGDFREYRGAAHREFWTRVQHTVEHRIEQLDRREPVRPVALYQLNRDADGVLFSRWQKLQSMAARFAVMAEKQLRGVDWSDAEAECIKNYHEELGEVMGYLGNAADQPEDDAPRWTTIAHDPLANRNVAVAIGRPMELWVLYPWHGRSILCRGAVMPFYEYAAADRLTDAEWRDLLDSPQAPRQPEWVQPILAAPAGRR